MYSAITSSVTLPLVQTKCRVPTGAGPRTPSATAASHAAAGGFAERLKGKRVPSGRVKLAVDYLNGGVTLGQLLGLMESPAFTADELTEVLTALSEQAKRDEGLVAGLHALIEERRVPEEEAGSRRARPVAWWGLAVAIAVLAVIILALPLRR